MPALTGRLEVATWSHLGGWAFDPESPDEPVELEVLDNGEPLATLRADQFRPDLREAGLAGGRCGFRLALRGGRPLGRPHVMEVRRSTDGRVLPGSPKTLQPPTSLDTIARESVSHLLAGAAVRAAGGAGFDPVLHALLDRIDGLLRQGDPDERSPVARAFRDRWAPILDRGLPARQPPPAPRPDPPSPRPPGTGAGRRALVIAEALPSAAGFPHLRSLPSRLAALCRLGFDVAIVPQTLDGDPDSVAALAAAGIACHRRPLVGSVEEVLRRESQLLDLVLIEGRGPWLRYGNMARDIVPASRLLLALDGLDSSAARRHAAVADRPELGILADRWRTQELMAAWSSDAVLIGSVPDAATLRAALPATEVHALPWAPPPPRTIPGWGGRSGAVLCGRFDEPADSDAAAWLIEEIAPAIRARAPGVPVRLLGPGLPRPLAAAAALAGIPVDPAPPDDPATLAGVRVALVPRRHGAGLPPALAACWAACVPCVTTPLAAEAVALPPGLADTVGNSAEEIADRVFRLATRLDAWTDCREAGRLLARRLADPDSIDALLRQVLRIADPAPRAAAASPA